MYDPCPGHHSLRDVFFFPLRLAFLGGGNFTCACVFRQFNHLTFKGSEGRGWGDFEVTKMSCKQTRNEKYIYCMEFYLNPKNREKIDLITKEDSKNVFPMPGYPLPRQKSKGRLLKKMGHYSNSMINYNLTATLQQRKKLSQ